MPEYGEADNPYLIYPLFYPKQICLYSKSQHYPLNNSSRRVETGKYFVDCVNFDQSFKFNNGPKVLIITYN